MTHDLGGEVVNFTTRLDQKLKVGPKTSFLNINDAFLGEFSGHGVVNLPTFTVNGLGDYNRQTGYPAGDAAIDWEPYRLRYDRGRKFEIDEMDDEEHLKLFTANVMGEFASGKVVPEVDAIRFALLSQGAGEVVEAGAISTAEAALDAVLDAEEYFENIGYEAGNLVLNITASMKRLLREAQPWRIGQGESPNTKFDTFDDMRINVIPANRFYTAIELLDGVTEGETEGGYKKATDQYVKTADAALVEGKTYYTKAGDVYTAVANPSAESLSSYYEKVQDAGKALNFLIAAPGSAVAITKHEKLRYFPPDVYQKADMHAWDYRLFHDLLVYEQKKELIYANVGV